MFFPQEEIPREEKKTIQFNDPPKDLQKYSTMIGYNPKLDFKRNKIDEINSILMEGMIGNLTKKGKKKHQKS